MTHETEKNLIRSWRQFLVHQDKTLFQGVTEMNDKLGTKVLCGHIHEYLHGKRKIHPRIQRYLTDEVFEFSAIQCGLKMVQLNEMLNLKCMLSIPEFKK